MLIKIFAILASLIYLADFLALGYFSYKGIKIESWSRRSSVYSLLLWVCSLFAFVLSVNFAVMSFKGSHALSLNTTVLILLLSIFIFAVVAFLQSVHMTYINLLNEEEAKRVKRNNIFSVLSHDIRTPLNTIIGLAMLISERKEITAKTRDDIEKISDAGDNLLSVVSNIIDFNTIESGSLTVDEKEYDTSELLKAIVDKGHRMLVNPTVEFLTYIDEDIPDRLYGDPARIRQAIDNLISNSCKFTHVGIITFRVGCSLAGDRAMLRFEIEDTGIGIKEEDQKGLLDLNLTHKYSSIFDKPDLNNKKPISKGQGLGLTVTNHIVHVMGGSISFSSEEGAGTTFTVLIPQKAVSSEKIGEISTEVSEVREKSGEFTAPMGKVLVVDDNIVNLFVAKELLSKYELEVNTVSSGKECLENMRSNVYDLIFMDYVMPEMDGHDTLIAIRANGSEYFKNVPVIALTAQIPNNNDKQYTEEGFQGYISKPINISDLENTLLRYLPKDFICRKDSTAAPEPEPVAESKDSEYDGLAAILTDCDLKKGLEYSADDINAYKALLGVIYSDSKGQADKMRNFYSAGDFDNYRITVHALKSVSASAGADKLSARFLEHEKAAKASDGQFIGSDIEGLISAYAHFIGQVKIAINAEDDNESVSEHLKETDSSEITAIVNDLLKALDDYSIDDCETLTGRLSAIDMSDSRRKAVKDVKSMLQMFKYEEAAALIRDKFSV